jgi:hypothetical protein
MRKIGAGTDQSQPPIASWPGVLEPMGSLIPPSSIRAESAAISVQESVSQITVGAEMRAIVSPNRSLRDKETLHEKGGRGFMREFHTK